MLISNKSRKTLLNFEVCPKFYEFSNSNKNIAMQQKYEFITISLLFFCKPDSMIFGCWVLIYLYIQLEPMELT